MNEIPPIPFIQYPQFQSSDLVFCLQISTLSGYFPGPFSGKSFIPISDIPFHYSTKSDALIQCSKFLFESEVCEKFLETKPENWNRLILHHSNRRPFQFLLDLSNSFPHEFTPKWFSSKEKSEEGLKKDLCLHPCEALIHQLFHSEIQKVLNQQTEWNTYHRLPVLYILLSARINQEKRIISNYSSNLSWRDQWKNILLSLSRINQPFGYRVAILLGCDLVHDFEGQIARKIINIILETSLQNHYCLTDSNLREVIFFVLKSFSQDLLEKEHICWESTPLLDFRQFLANLLYYHFSQSKMQEKELQNNMSCNFDKLIKNILFHIEEKNLDFDTQTLIEKQKSINDSIRSDIHEAFNIAEKIKSSTQKQGYFSFLSQTTQLSILYQDSTLDFYFKSHHQPLQDLISSCDQMIKFYNNKKFAFNALNTLHKEFPEIDRNNLSFDEFAQFQIHISYLSPIISAIKLFTPFFVPLSSHIFNHSFSSDPLLLNTFSSSDAHDFNLLVEEHKGNFIVELFRLKTFQVIQLILFVIMK
jgi:hypothetical protein